MMDTSEPTNARTPVTEKDVWQAADHLWIKKETPSAPKIREELGSGSLHTIQKHLDSWREREWEQPAQNDSLLQELLRMRKKYNQEANSLAEKKVAQFAQECEERTTKAAQLQRLAEQERDSLSKQFQTQQQELAKLSEAHLQLNNKFKEEEKKRYEAEVNNRQLEKETLETKKRAQELLDTQSAEYEQKARILQEQIKKIESTNEVALAKLNEEHKIQQQISHEKIASLQTERMELEKKIHIIGHSEKSYREKLQDSENQLKDNIKRLQKLEYENHELTKTLHDTELQLATVNSELKQVEKQSSEFKLQIKESQSALLAQKEHTGKLEEKLQQLHLKNKEKQTKLIKLNDVR